MKKNIQLTMICKLDRTGDEIHTERTSFCTLDKAIEKAEMFIYRKEEWIDTTMLKAVIINKENKEVLWSWEA